jgi:hypothetical protein
MIQAAIAGAFLVAMGVALCPQPAGAVESCPQEVTKSKKLTGNVDCSQNGTASDTRLDGVKITKNGVVFDRNGYSIIGPDTQTQINNHTETKPYGIHGEAKRNVTIKNCINVLVLTTSGTSDPICY